MDPLITVDIKTSSQETAIENKKALFTSIENLQNDTILSPIETKIIRATEVTFRKNTQKTARSYCEEVLNEVYIQLTEGATDTHPLSKLYQILEEVRMTVSEKEWLAIIQDTISVHPLKTFISQDPCTHRSIKKPRGYSGDAELLDYFYSDSFSLSGANQTSKMLLNHTISRPAGVSVKERLRIIGNMVDQVGETHQAPKVLSIACGHFREIYFSRSVFSKQVEMVGLDQDEQSLQFVQDVYSNLNVSAKKASVLDFLKDKHGLKEEKFDFVYASGLFDYLSNRLASKLVEKMLKMTKPGGAVLVNNFLTGIPDRGYMEAFMDWFLIYRTPAEIDQFCDSSFPSLIKEKRYFEGANGNIGYLQLIRR